MINPSVTGVRLDPRTAKTSVGTVQQFIVQTGEGIQANWRQTRGAQAEGSGTEGCSGYQGRDDEDGSGTSRVETKEAIREIILESFACC